MSAGDFRIQPMTRPDLDLAVEWAAAEGWNPGLHDADPFFAADPKGFLVGRLDGEPIGCISAVKYGETFGFLGFYIVKPEYRGQGYGIKIWDAGMDALEGRNIGLDGVVEQQENYRKSEFALAYRNIRYRGQGMEEEREFSGIVDLSTLPFDLVETYDRPFFSAERTNFLKSWIHPPRGKALGILENDELSGYAVIRPCRDGFKIGPLFANDGAKAENLFRALSSGIPADEPIFLDVPEVNSAAIDLAERHEMEIVFETARMYTKAAPELPLNRLFGVTSFELG